MYNNKLFSGKSLYLKNILLVAGGAAIAQGLAIMISPIIARLYTPADFGAFAFYSSILSLLTVASTGRYELAITLPAEDSDAKTLCALIMLMVGITSVLATVAGFIVSSCGIGTTANSLPEGLLYFLPLSILSAGAYQVLYSLALRGGNFQQMSTAKISSSVFGALSNVAAGLSKLGSAGLVVASIAAQTAGSATLVWRHLRSSRGEFKGITVTKMMTLAKTYYRFPLYSMPSDFLNAAAQQMPVLLFSSYFSASVVGYYSFAMRILGLPVALISSSVTDAFRNRATSDLQREGNCRNIFDKTFLGLFWIGLGPFLVFTVFAPSLFEFVFGKEWREAGEFGQVCAVLFYLRFIVSPLSYVLILRQRQMWDMIGQASLLALTVLAIVVGAAANSEKVALVLYTGVYSAVYILYFIASYRLSR